MDQNNLFDLLYSTFKFNKKQVTLFEAFSGIGTQAMALKRLSKEYNFDLKVVGVSEIDKYAIASYESIHGETKNFGSIANIQNIPQVDIFTYSFPCTDISNAGRQEGFSKGSETRSGLLWEVERILINQSKLGKLPKVLLLENVKALISKKFMPDFKLWLSFLEKLGYSNTWEVLNAKDFGVAQNRERVFVVSILGEYSYNFPQPFKLEKRLKDYLEQDVDEKFYVKDHKIQKQLKENYDQFKDFNLEPRISYALGSREHEQRGWLDLSPTLCARDYKDPKVVAELRSDEGIRTFKDNVVGTLRSKDSGGDKVVINKELRIRKLTPKETWRLMGCSDEDFDKAQKVCSNSQLYKQAGNAIVVDVLYYIFKQLFN